MSVNRQSTNLVLQDKFYFVISQFSIGPLLATVRNPTLQVVGLQIPCAEKAGVAVDAPNYL